MNPILIEMSRLGVLDQQLRGLVAEVVLKRTRQREFRRLARILRDLRLIPSHPVAYLSLAVNGAGDLGLLVVFDSPTHEVGPVEPVRICTKSATCTQVEGHSGPCDQGLFEPCRYNLGGGESGPFCRKERGHPGDHSI